jgi:hypothetical protein
MTTMSKRNDLRNAAKKQNGDPQLDSMVASIMAQAKQDGTVTGKSVGAAIGLIVKPVRQETRGNHITLTLLIGALVAQGILDFQKFNEYCEENTPQVIADLKASDKAAAGESSIISPE